MIGILQGRLTPSKGRGIQFFPHENWQNEFCIAKQIGFDCIELLAETDLEENPFWSQSELDKIQQVSRSFGIGIHSVHGFYSTDVRKLEKLIKHTMLIGANILLIPLFDNNELKSKEDWDTARGVFKEIAPLCEDYGVCVGIETEQPAEKLLKFFHSIHSLHIGTYYDIGNMASMGVNVEEEIRLLSSRIFGVHIKDRQANGGKSVPLGIGCANFKSIFQTLKKVGYKRPYIIQGARNESVEDVSLNQEYLSLVRQWEVL